MKKLSHEMARPSFHLYALVFLFSSFASNVNLHTHFHQLLIPPCDLAKVLSIRRLSWDVTSCLHLSTVPFSLLPSFPPSSNSSFLSPFLARNQFFDVLSLVPPFHKLCTSPNLFSSSTVNIMQGTLQLPDIPLYQSSPFFVYLASVSLPPSPPSAL